LNEILDYYKVPLSFSFLELAEENGKWVDDRLTVLLFASDERYFRLLGVEVQLPAGWPKPPNPIPEMLMTRSAFGSLVIKSISKTIETLERKNEYTADEWNERMLNLIENKRRWHQEVYCSAAPPRQDEAAFESSTSTTPGCKSTGWRAFIRLRRRW
jgi:hypothetical protein